MGFLLSKARLDGQFSLARLSVPRGPLQIGVTFPRRITLQRFLQPFRLLAHVVRRLAVTALLNRHSPDDRLIATETAPIARSFLRDCVLPALCFASHLS